MMYPYGYGGGPFGGFAALAMMVLGLIVLIAVVLIIVWAVRSGEEHRHVAYGQHPGQMHGGQQWHPAQPGTMMPGGQQQADQQQGGRMTGRDPAVDAARERYARGEITKEELDEITRNLGY